MNLFLSFLIFFAFFGSFVLRRLNKEIAQLFRRKGCMFLEELHVMAFGDSMNDESMIVKCGLSVAMSNGLDKIKDEAAFVTRLTNDQDGIADFVEQFVLI